CMSAQLLTEFARTQSEEAFAGIVRQYVDLVYSTARRMVGDAHLAEDVTQAAFMVLARKAGSVTPGTLAGWLVNTTRLTAKQAIRSKLCREKHETKAAGMRNELNASADEPTASELSPLLDDALSRLSDADRAAVVLRFFQGLSFVEV